MKKILIITSRSEKTVSWKEREVYVRDFCKAVEKELNGAARVIYTTFADLCFSVINGENKIYDNSNEIDLDELDYVHFKNWTTNNSEALTVAKYLKARKINYNNSDVGNAFVSGKLGQMFILSEKNIPVPDTFYMPRISLKEVLSKDLLPKDFQYPLIMKANDGSRGDDNFLIQNADEGLKVIANSDEDKEFILQNFIANDGDYRFLFIGVDSQPLVFHRKAVKGSHLNNTSKGGSGSLIDIGSIPKEQIQYARQAAMAMGREIGGVDILIDSKISKPYILEVNGTPALATGYGVDLKIKKFADYIDQLEDLQEEE